MDLLCVALYGRWDTVENQFIHLFSHDVRVHCPNLCIALAVAAAAPGFRLRGCLGRVVDTMQSMQHHHRRVFGATQRIEIEIVFLTAFKEIVSHVHERVGLDWFVAIRVRTVSERDVDLFHVFRWYISIGE